MAELNVQPKPRSTWWIWLIVILIIAVAAYIWYTNNSQSNESISQVFTEALDMALKAV